MNTYPFMLTLVSTLGLLLSLQGQWIATSVMFLALVQLFIADH